MITVNCGQCNKEIKKLPEEIKKSKSGLSFCNRSCSAKYNNSRYPKNKKRGICKECGDSISSKLVYCRGCYETAYSKTPLNKTDDPTLEECIYFEGNNQSNRYGLIRYYAKKFAKKNCDMSRCEICGYDKHVEVCHIKAIKDFPLTSKLSEINNKENIVILCPNHHWELDHGELIIEAIRQAGHDPAT